MFSKALILFVWLTGFAVLGQQCGDERSIATAPNDATNGCFNDSNCFSEVEPEAVSEISSHYYMCLVKGMSFHLKFFYGCFRRQLRGNALAKSERAQDKRSLQNYCTSCIQNNGSEFICQLMGQCRRRLDEGQAVNEDRQLSSILPMAADEAAFQASLSDPCWVDDGGAVDNAFTSAVNNGVSNSKKTSVSYVVQTYECGC